jgi:hypothetical protein
VAYGARALNEGGYQVRKHASCYLTSSSDVLLVI